MHRCSAKRNNSSREEVFVTGMKNYWAVITDVVVVQQNLGVVVGAFRGKYCVITGAEDII